MAEVNSEVWVRDDDSSAASVAWSAGTVTERTATHITVSVEGAGETARILTVPATTERDSSELANVKLRNLDYARFPTQGRGGVDDLIQLTHLHEPAILDVVERRFANDCLYTFTGPILLAVNPFQRLPLYTTQILEEYYMAGMLKATGVEARQLPPHVYAVADHAYRAMMNSEARRKGANRNQSMLVSGESGAGKTETTKIIMQYLATVGRPKADTGLPASPQSPSTPLTTAIERRVLQSNPILEAFGNAKTLRNENSSRFGKFISMQFSSNGELQGAKIETYLLEKVRLVAQNAGERNYHIFYQLLAGCTPELRTELALSKPEDYHFLNQSGCFSLREVDDSEEYTATLQAFSILGMDDDVQMQVLRILAGLLHLSNLQFVDVDGATASLASQLAARVASTSGGGKGGRGAAASQAVGCSLAPAAAESVGHVCNLLGITRDALQSALTSKEIVVGRDRVTTKFTLTQAAAAVEATAKAMYGRLFLWLVMSINKRLCAPSERVSTFIGVLDIFGFEHFEQNSFEQLCINYANETLQQQFNQFVFKLEQAEYEREKIEWSVVDFPDNQDCLDLIEARKLPGILPLLDEQCLLQSATDSTFVKRMYTTYASNGRFSASKLQQAREQFCIRHYAGVVEYTVFGFIEKNRDAVHNEVLELLATSSSPLLSSLFKPESWTSIMEAIAPPVPAPEAGAGAAAGAAARGARATAAPSKGGLMSETVGVQFKSQLASLMTVIRATAPHYIRCLKPNSRQVPKLLERVGVVSQLRCGGVLEAVRVARLGYPVRSGHTTFLSTYRVLVSRDVFDSVKAGAKGCAKEACRLLLPHLSVTDGSVQVGETKVFVRQAAFDQLENARQKVLTQSATKIQAVYAGYRARVYFKAVKRMANHVARLYRGRCARVRYQKLREERAGPVLFNFTKFTLARRRYLRFRSAIISLQTYQRRYAAKQFVHKLRRERKAVMIQSAWRAFVARAKFRVMRAAAIQLQCWARQRHAVQQLKRYRAEAREVGNLRSTNEELKVQVKLLTQQLADLQAAYDQQSVQLASQAAAIQTMQATQASMASSHAEQSAARADPASHSGSPIAPAVESAATGRTSTPPAGTPLLPDPDAETARPMVDTEAATSGGAAGHVTSAASPAATAASTVSTVEVTSLRLKLVESESKLEVAEKEIASLRTALAHEQAARVRQAATPVRSASRTDIFSPASALAVVSGEASAHAGAAAGEGGEVAEAALGGGAATMGAPARVTPGRGATSGDWQAASSRRAERNEAANARDKRERLALEKRMLVAEKVAEDEKAARIRLEHQVASLKSQLSASSDTEHVHVESATNLLQKQVLELTAQVNALSANNAEQSSQIAHLRNAVDAAQNDAAAEAAKSRDYIDELEALRLMKEHNQHVMFSLMRQMEKATSERDEVFDLLKDMQNRLATADGERTAFRAQVIELVRLRDEMLAQFVASALPVPASPATSIEAPEGNASSDLELAADVTRAEAIARMSPPARASVATGGSAAASSRGASYGGAILSPLTKARATSARANSTLSGPALAVHLDETGKAAARSSTLPGNQLHPLGRGQPIVSPSAAHHASSGGGSSSGATPGAPTGTVSFIASLFGGSKK